ncbi:quinone oxidoreductase family protein [Nocardioides caldifontis]|uniref:quinone oxidoreductase family protein n=1 Tax=Nocardioides caldifontis TaxID=2588938 RepID=UPI0011DF6571|nr:zinc-binding alcohol dehydrogenase family protein [Nocardioides caldifontis]
MHAAVVRTAGTPPEYAEHPTPLPAEGSTVVRVTAAPVVPLDLLCASGSSYFGVPRTPYVPGVQGVGVAERSEVLEPGTRVWFATSAGMKPCDGSLAERCLVVDDDLVPLTTSVDDVAVAALGLSAVAAWMALTWRGGFRAGETVLVLGAGGAVGQVAVGAARALGAARVVAACRSEASADRARAAGADRVVLLTDDEGQLAARFEAALGGTADVVVDPVFGTPASAAARVLSPAGRLVNLGGSAGDRATFSSAMLRSGSLDLRGYTNNALTPAQRREALTALLRHAEDGAVAVAHDARPLSEVADAWRVQQAQDAGVRLVLVP